MLHSLTKLPVEQIEPIAKTVAAFIALVYTLGLLITNKYLISYGISDFSSLRPRYIFTGIWALWFMMLASVPGLTLWHDWSALLRRRQWKKLGLATLVTGVVFNISLTPLGLSSGWFLWGLFSALTANALVIVIFVKGIRSIGSLHRIYVGGTAAVLFMSCVGLLSNPAFYGSIPEGLGGGKPMTATLILDPQGVSVWTQSGMSSAADATRNSPKVRIIYQDEHNLYVEDLNRAKIVIISRSLVDLILPDPEH